MTWLILFVLGSYALAAFFRWRLGTFLNPVSLFSLAFATSTAIALALSSLEDPLGVYARFLGQPESVALIYSLGLGAFAFPWCFLPGRQRLPALRPAREDAGARPAVLKLIGLLWVSLGVTLVMLGGIPLLRMIAMEFSIVDHIRSLEQLWPGVMMVNLAVASVLSLYLASVSIDVRGYGITRRLLVVAVVTLLIASTWQGNRQLLLIVLFMVIARRFLSYAQTDRSAEVERGVRRLRFFVMLLGGGFVVFFIGINFIRLASTGEFSGPLELLQYFSWPVFNMSAIDLGCGSEGRGECYFLTTELLPARLGGRDHRMELAQLLFEPTSPSGYLAYWYLDFGYAGVIVGAGLLSVVSMYLFKKAGDSEHHMRRYLLVLWCCITSSVYNHFIALTFWATWVLLDVVGIFSRGARRPLPVAGELAAVSHNSEKT